MNTTNILTPLVAVFARFNVEATVEAGPSDSTTSHPPTESSGDPNWTHDGMMPAPPGQQVTGINLEP